MNFGEYDSDYVNKSTAKRKNDDQARQKKFRKKEDFKTKYPIKTVFKIALFDFFPIFLKYTK